MNPMNTIRTRAGRIIAILSAALVFTNLSGTDAALAHIWTHSDLHYGSYGSEWRARSHLSSDSMYDFYGMSVHAKLNGTIVRQLSVSCGPVNESCGTDDYTPYIYFPKASGSYLVFSQNCASDDSHQLHPWSHGQFGGVCRGYNVDYNHITLNPP